MRKSVRHKSRGATPSISRAVENEAMTWTLPSTLMVADVWRSYLDDWQTTEKAIYALRTSMHSRPLNRMLSQRADFTGSRSKVTAITATGCRAAEVLKTM
jgi:hypothetical protein